jgi:hypothetical protein
MEKDVKAHVQETLKKNKEASDRTTREGLEALRGRPTPTQEENDRTALGEHIIEHEEDGSRVEGEGRAMGSEGGSGSYQNRSMGSQTRSTEQTRQTQQKTEPKQHS